MGSTAADFTAIANEFDDLIFKTDTSWFGAPTDINKDGRITILYTPEVNKFTPKGSPSYIGGFFWGGDLFTKADYTQAGHHLPADERTGGLLSPGRRSGWDVQRRTQHGAR